MVSGYDSPATNFEVFQSSFMTEGSNLKGIWAFCQGEGVLDEIESNDIHAMLQTYGVEAARATIIQEMLNVFGVYSIKVDPRHLSVIADYMVRSISFAIYTILLICHLSDIRWRIQALQSSRYCLLKLRSTQSIVRNDWSFPHRRDLVRRL